MTNEIEGGMMTPMPPAVAMRAAAVAGLYPTFTIAGMITPPRAATVAGPDPEMAAKKLAELEAEARRRWPVIEVALAHRVGKLELGDVSVVVAVSPRRLLDEGGLRHVSSP